MNRKLQIIVMILAIIGTAFTGASLALHSLLSPERLRTMLVEPVEEQLGRKIEIGAVKISLFSGIDIKDIVIREKDPAREFASISNLRLRYELLPLFGKRLVIKEVSLDKPSVKIFRNAQGIFNYADISLKPKKLQKEIPPPELQTVEPLPLTLIFDQVKINDLDLTLTDQTGELPAITGTDGDLSLSVTLGKTLAEAKYQGTLDLIVNTKFNGSKPVLLFRSTISDQLISFRGELNVEFDKLRFKGQLANQLSTPDLTLDLQGDNLDLKKLAGLKPAGQKTGGGPSLMASAPAEPQPPIRRFRAHGKISIKKLHRDKLAIHDLNLTYKFADNLLDLSDLSAELFGGSISGKAGLQLGGPTPAFRGQLRAEKLQMTAAMQTLDKPKGYLAGELSADFSGRGVGSRWPQIRDSLDGQGTFSVVEGGLASSPISQALASLLSIPELNNLRFDKFAGTMLIADGRAALDSSLSSKVLDMQTKGSAGLDGSLDLPLALRLSPEYSHSLQERAAFARYLTDPSGRITLNLKLRGTIDHPNLTLDGEGAGRQLKNALAKKAGEELARALSRKVDEMDSRNPKTAGETREQLFKLLPGKTN